MPALSKGGAMPVKEVKVFLICPVAKCDLELEKRIADYVNRLEQMGTKVHWPKRDTEQKDSNGGYDICKTNFQAIMATDEIHIWYSEASGGSKFDMGGVFMLTEMLGWKKRVVIVNEKEIQDDSPKSFFQVFRRISNRFIR